MYETVHFICSQNHSYGFFMEKLKSVFFKTFASSDVWQNQEDPKPQKWWQFFLFLEELFLRAYNWVLFACFLLPIQEWMKVPKILSMFASTFSKSYFRITNLNSSINGSSSTSAFELNYSLETWWFWIFAWESWRLKTKNQWC